MNRVYGLDALRGVAAFIVLFMHVAGFVGGHLAVDFFFMLSGYVMARSYEGRLRVGKLSALGFLFARYRRLWPTMSVGATIGFLLYISTVGASSEAAIGFAFALLLIPSSPSIPYFLNLPAWSIFYELLANALHGVLFVRMRIKALCATLLVCLGALIFALETIGFPRILGETTLAMQVMVLFRALTSYLIGILLFRLLRDRSPIRLPLGFGLLAIPVYIGLVSMFHFSYWALPFILGVAPLAIMSGLDQKAPKNSSQLLGDLSFPLYATHYPIIQAVAYAGGGSAAALALSIGAAYLWVYVSRTRAKPIVAAA